MNIIGVSMPFPGVSRVLEEAEKAGMLRFCPIAGDRLSIPPADVYILGAWHPFYDQLLPHLDGKVGVLWTSSVGEMQLEPVEQDYLRKILADPRIDFIWFGDPGLAAVFQDKGFYAPYPMSLDIKRPDVQKQDIVTMLCPATVKKNILAQVLAVSLVQREVDVTLHVNFRVDPMLKEMTGLRVVEHGWLERDAYIRLLASSRLALAASLAETFDYGAAEAVLLGTPCLLSMAIPWAPFHRGTAFTVGNASYLAREAMRIFGEEGPEKVLAVQQRDLIKYSGRARTMFEHALAEHLTPAS